MNAFHHGVLRLILWVCLLPLIAMSEENIEDIFADLGEFEPQTVEPVAIETPQSVPTNQPVRAVFNAPPPAPAPLEEPIYAAKIAVTEPLDVDYAVAQGIEAYKKKDLKRAQNLFEAVLYEDAHHKTAIRYLKKIAAKTETIERKSYEAMRRRKLTEVQAAWNTPKPEGGAVTQNEQNPETSEEALHCEEQIQRLEEIRIPSLIFNNAALPQVVVELSDLIRELDPEKHGINLVAFGTQEASLPSITFSGVDLSAREALDIIAQMAGLKYEIGPSCVSLMPVNYRAPERFVSAELDVTDAVGDRMVDQIERSAQTASSGLIDVRAFFSTIAFPPGASAQYNSDFGILLVLNAPQQVERMQALLEHYHQKALAERSRQVEIETKFIEISEGSLDELGFEWTLAPGEDYVNNDRWSVVGDQKLFTDTLRSGEEAFSQSVAASGRASTFNSLASAVTDATGDGLVGTAGEVVIQKVTGTPAEVIIRALERQAGSDLLSAPKVLAKSGETARIHVGEIHWYPTAYDVAVERYAQPTLIPLDYEEEHTGVILSVTPELDAETKTIDLKLSPEIRELAGFDEQHVGTIWPEFGDESLDMDGESAGSELLSFLTAREENRTLYADRLIARRPVFKIRKVETAVTIQDGSTIAMGGLIKESLETFKDSVPILGRIPLIGRFFRSEGERSIKRNLMIFVTARQVDVTGHTTEE